MRVRLAVEHPPVYNAVRDNYSWADHAARTLTTAALIAWIRPNTICDPACGDASILEAAFRLAPFEHATLRDISGQQIDALRPSFPHDSAVSDIETALDAMKPVNLMLLTEILEHLEDPDRILRLARAKSEILIASSPIGDPEKGGNHEHLWAWDEPGYEQMLRECGWTPAAKVVLTYPGTPWNCQIWVAR